jgi:hypothetical protein
VRDRLHGGGRVNARNNFIERCLAAKLGAEEWRLAAALDLHILSFYDKDARAYLTEGFVGDALLRATGRLHGRSLDRARNGLIEKGLTRFEPGTLGAGHRSFYKPNTDAPEKPAQERAFDEPPEKPASEPEKPAEKPAKKPAEKPAPARGRLKAEELQAGPDDDVVGGTDPEQEEIWAWCGPLNREQRETFTGAWTTNPAAVRLARDQAPRQRNVRNPVALFLSWLEDGTYLTLRPAEPPPEPEPCEYCDYAFGGHAPDCPRAQRSTPSPGICPECECPVSGRHLEGCTLGGQVTVDEAVPIANSNGDGGLRAREQAILDEIFEEFPGAREVPWRPPDEHRDFDPVELDVETM